MAIDFFISYAREDADYARDFVKRLTDHKWTVWLDEKDIPPSVPWMTEIKRSIDDSMMVVAIESADWLSSDACQIEAGLAEKGRVPVLRIATDAAQIGDRLAEVVRAYRALPTWRALSLDAATSAAIWDSAGRKRSLLSRGRPLTQMRRALRLHPTDFSPAATAFITTSARAADRRIVTSLVLGFTVPILIAAIGVTAQVTLSVNQKVSKSIADSTAFAQRDAYYDWNTYAGLERASADISKSFARYRELFIDLTDRTPSRWDSTAVTKSGPLVTTLPGGNISAAADGAAITITDPRGKFIRLLAPAAITAIAWSPDSRWVAVATIDGADVISVSNGQVIPLRGGAGTSISVHWNDAQHVSVGGSAGTGVWKVFDGTNLTSVGSVRYGTRIRNTLYTVDNAGSMTSTDVATGRSKRLSQTIPAGASPAAIDSTGREVVVAFSGLHPFLEVVDTKTQASRDIRMSVCSPLGLSLSPDGKTAYLACNEENANETRVKLTTGSVISRPYQTQLAYGVRALNDRVLWGGVFGAVFQSSLDLAPQGILSSASGCDAPTRRFIGPSNGSELFPIGDATGSFACATRIEIKGGVQVDHLIFNPTDGHAVPDAAISPSGSLIAYGLSDGQVRVFTTAGFDPVYFAQVLPDQVRSISFSSNGRELVVAGLDGQVVTVPLPFTTAAQGARVLESEGLTRLNDTTKWGIYTSTMDQSGSSK